ncbi:phage tail tape measure C-terminal domain-containing protein [Citrobacter portucalensis]|uniref:phage tail tape measure C-terminal domain-containing protein n=1 Tax=Citrobacter portucalensis TaxID=1639133 RepID=UPI002549D0BD|nr:phage tail tape measure C-terminal domain-containing protein [Citrobacter portucalensis]
MSGTDAELGFSVDTSQVETASTRLDELAKSAQGVTSSIDKMADSFKSQNLGDGMRRGLMGNITRDFQSMQNSITNEIINDGEKAGKGWWSNFINGVKENHNAQRELGVMGHELMSGRWANLRGSAAIMMGSAGVGGLASTGIVMGLTAAVEGIEALTESIQEAAQAQKDLQQSAILSGNAGALFSGRIDEIVNGLQTVKDASREVKEEFVTNALNSGLAPDFLKKNGSMLLQYQQEFGDKQTEALEKILAETQTDATKGYAALYKMGDGLLDKVNNDIQSGNYKAAGADMIAQLMQGAQNELRESQKNQHELDGDSWWDTTLQYMGMGSLGYSAAGVQTQQKILNGIKQKKDAIVDANKEANAAIQKSIDSVKSPDLSRTKAYHNFSVYNHPSFGTHTGKTEAEKSAEKAQRALEQLKSSIYGIDEQSSSLLNSVNRRWGSKMQPFSDLSHDAYDFQQSQDQINQQFDKMIDRVNELCRRQGKSANNSAFDSEITKIMNQRDSVLKANQDGFESYEDSLHSAVAGMKEAWKNYDEKVDDIAAQQATVWSKSLDLMTDDLTDFLTTGTADFEKFFKNIAVMEEKYMVQNWLVRPMNDYIGGLMGFGSSSSLATQAVNSFAVPEIPKLGATHFGGGLGSTAPTINITINDNGNKGVDSKVNASGGDAQKLGIALDKFMQNYIKQQNVNSNRQGGINKSMGNWSTR